MSRIAALPLEQAPEATRPLLEGVQKKIGFLPNVFKVLAQAPAVLASYVQQSTALGKTSLSATEKEAIFLATSQVNGCDYCLAAHTVFAGKAGLSKQDILSARHGELNAYATLAQQITESRGHLSVEQIEAARAAGINDSKIIEVIFSLSRVSAPAFLPNSISLPAKARVSDGRLR